MSHTAELINDYRKNKRFTNLEKLCICINRHLDRHSVSGRYFVSDIKNQKSIYHLLFNLSNAQIFINKYQ